MASLLPNQQHIAVALYGEGKSAREVAEHFNVGIGAVYYLLKYLKVPRRSAAQNSAIRFKAKPMSFNLKNNLTLEEEKLRLAAVMLYWAEGYKIGKAVDFANADPAMAFLFRNFLSRICRIDETRLRCSLFCYEGQDIESLTRFWSGYLNVPAINFTKPYVKKAVAPGPRGPRMIHGLVHVRYCDKKLLTQILDWIDEYTQTSVGGRAVNCKGL